MGPDYTTGITGSISPVYTVGYFPSSQQLRLSPGAFEFVGQVAVCGAVYPGVTSRPVQVYDGTPEITSVSPPSPWTAGTTVQATIWGHGFGSSPTLSIPGLAVSNVYSGTVGLYQFVQATVSIPADASPSYLMTVTSNGSAGLGFTPDPGQPAGNSASRTIAVAPPQISLRVQSFNYATQTMVDLTNNQCAFIDGTPTMPEIIAQVINTSTGQPVSTGTAQFNLKLEFFQGRGVNDPGEVQTAHHVWNLVETGPLHFHSAATPWRVRPNVVLGGGATVSWWYNGIQMPNYQFCVRAYNPSVPDITAALDASPFWFLCGFGNQSHPYIESDPQFGPP